MQTEIDASMGEGGGQILRTSLALAALLQKPVSIENIRANRPKPGLQPQHLTALQTLAKISNADVKGAQPKSTSIFFHSGKISPISLNVNIGTAGSISLLLSQILPVAMLEETKLRVVGGTDVPFSPPISYLQQALLPALRKMGCKFEIGLIKHGFFPKGNGIVSFSSKPASLPLKPINLTEQGKLQFIKIFSHGASLPKEVSVNQLNAARKGLQGICADFEELCSFEPERKDTIGSVCSVFAFFSNGAVIGASALGAKGKPATDVGKEAAANLLQELEANAPCDSHLADQLIPFMALARGRSEILATKITEHAKTNIAVTEKLLDVKFSIEGNKISVEGAAYK